MKTLSVHEQRERESQVTLANANELVAHVVMEVAGNDVSNTLNGSRITSSVIKTLAQARFRDHLNKQRGSTGV